MGQGTGIREVAIFDCAGGGQVGSAGQTACVRNMRGLYILERT